MNVYRVSGGTIEARDPSEAGALLGADDGFVWLDVPERTADAEA